MTEAAIGVFDSGVGGLTVLRALEARLPHEHTVYLGDTARVPYGTRSADVVIKYARNNARALLARRPLKMLVVACNTASAVALDALAQDLPIPVVGVIRPGAEAARAASRGGGVLVLGTAGTVRSAAYVAALRNAGHTGDITQRACPLLVPLVEEGWVEGDIPNAILRRYLHDLPADLDTIILGCTHYPLLRPAIEDVLRAMSRDVRVVDGGDATARTVRALLEDRGELRGSGHAEREFLVTDAPESVAAIAPRFLGRAVHDVDLVDILPANAS